MLACFDCVLYKGGVRTAGVWSSVVFGLATSVRVFCLRVVRVGFGLLECGSGVWYAVAARLVSTRRVDDGCGSKSCVSTIVDSRANLLCLYLCSSVCESAIEFARCGVLGGNYTKHVTIQWL